MPTEDVLTHKTIETSIATEIASKAIETSIACFSSYREAKTGN